MVTHEEKFDWEKMPPDASTQENAEKVAYFVSPLLRDMSIAANVHYELGAGVGAAIFSTTRFFQGGYILKKFGFEYAQSFDNSSIFFNSDYFFPTLEFYKSRYLNDIRRLIETNLDLGHVVVFDIPDKIGHAYVVEGYGIPESFRQEVNKRGSRENLMPYAYYFLNGGEGAKRDIKLSNELSPYRFTFNVFPRIPIEITQLTDFRGSALNPEIISGRVFSKKEITGPSSEDELDEQLYVLPTLLSNFPSPLDLPTVPVNRKNGVYAVVVPSLSKMKLTVIDSSGNPHPDYVPRTEFVGSSGQIFSAIYSVGNVWGCDFHPADKYIVSGSYENSDNILGAKVVNYDFLERQDFSSNYDAFLQYKNVDTIFVESDSYYDVNGNSENYTEAVENAKTFVNGGGTVIATGKSSAFPALIGNQPVFYKFSNTFRIYSENPTKVIRMSSPYMKEIFGNVEFQFTSSLPQREHSLIQLAGNSTIHAIALYALQYTSIYGWESVPEYAPTAIEYNYGSNGGKVIYSNLEFTPNYVTGSNPKKFIDVLLDPVLFGYRDKENLSRAIGGGEYYDNPDSKPVNWKQSDLNNIVYKNGATISNTRVNEDISFMFTIGNRWLESTAPDVVDSTGEQELIVSLYKPSGELYATRKAISGDCIVGIGVPAADNTNAGEWKFVVEDVCGYEGNRLVILAIVEGLYDIDHDTLAGMINDYVEKFGEDDDWIDEVPIYDVIAKGQPTAPVASHPRGIVGGTFHHQLGDRSNVVEPGTASRISFGGLIRSADVKVWRIDDDLVLSVSGTTDKVTVPGWFGQRRGEGSASVSEVSFHDGTVFDINALASRAEVREPEKQIIVVSSDRRIIGTSGSDNLTGDEDSNDTFFADAGDDTMTGNGGVNVYYYSRGWGDDTVIDSKENGDYGIIRFDIDIKSTDVTASRDGDDMKFSVDKGSITIRGWYENERSKIDNVQFFDGDVWDTRDVERLANGESLPEREAVLDAPGLALPEYANEPDQNTNADDDADMSLGVNSSSGGCDAGLLSIAGLLAAAAIVIGIKRRG